MQTVESSGGGGGQAGSPPGARPARVRAAVPEDEVVLRETFSRLSARTIHGRFHLPYPRVPDWMAAYLTDASRFGGTALVALAGGQIVGHAMYVRSGDGREAEIAVLVEDRWQSKGIGGRLLRELAARASREGVELFFGEILGENRHALALASTVFPEARGEAGGGTYRIRMALHAARAENPGVARSAA